MGYNKMAKLAHALEDLFHAAERKSIVLDASAISTSFVVLDKMTSALASIKEKNEEVEVDEQVSVLTLLLKNSKTQEQEIEKKK